MAYTSKQTVLTNKLLNRILENLQLSIEALLFSAQQPVSVAEIRACLEKSFEQQFKEVEIVECVELIINKYHNDYFAFELVAIGGGYQFLTKPLYHKTIATYANQKAKKKLSTATLETLAIIAYKQPITKAEIEQIRGVNCDYSVQKLLEKELVEISGRNNALPGRPLLYNTSQFFMDYFGIGSMKDLPKLKEIQPVADNEIGALE